MKMNEPDFLSQQFGRKSKSKIKKVESNLAVKYTRVSGGKQLETDSIQNQNRSIDEYANRVGMQVIASFGHTNESAKTDDRKEFQRMIDFCRRSNGKISTILVYKMTRFSRSGGKAISLADDLRNKYGIHIIAVSEQVDTSHSTGVVMQNMQLIFAAWDNAQRKEVTQSGMKSKYEKGEWLSQLPPGYMVIKENKERKILLNEEGQKIKEAWHWKYNGMCNEEICARLKERGVNMYKQKIYKIFKNPFYCGLVAHGILDGKVVEGKQEPMVSREMFFKINEVIQSSTRYGVPHKKENVQMPLKVFMKCAACKSSMTGYIVKKKNLYYYKCRKKGCNCNKSASKMHKMFLDILSKYSVKQEYLPILSETFEEAYEESQKETKEQSGQLEKRLTEISKIVEDLDVQLYIKKEITREKYQTLITKLEKEKKDISEKLEGLAVPCSNLAQKIARVAKYARNLPELWEKTSADERTSLQRLVFPEGLLYDKKTDAVLTPRFNTALFEIARYSGDSRLKEKCPDVIFNIRALFAERTLPVSNLKSLNELETNRLAKSISPHKIPGLNDGTPADILLRDLAAVSEFLFYVEAEPFVTPEKAENLKRLAFKKVKAS